MSKVVAAILLVVAGTAAFLLAPSPAPADLGELPAARPAGALGCLLRADREGVGSVGVAGTGPARITALAGGEALGDVALTGEGEVASSDLGVSGILGGVVELDRELAGAGVLVAGSAGISSAPCTPPGTGMIVVAGASTRSREDVTLVVSNPYAIDAVAQVRLGSETGTEAVEGVEALFVPARTTLTRDLGRLVPLRETLSVSLAVERGALHAAVAETGGSDTMLIEGAAPATTWWVPLPPFTTTPGRIVVVPAAEAPVEVRLETFGDGGAGSRDVSLAAGEQLVVGAAELGPGVTGVAVSAETEVTAAAVFDAAGFRAGGPGVSALGPDWAVGPARGTATIWVLVPGDLDAAVEVSVPGGRTSRAEAPAGALTGIPVPPSGSGYTVRASTEVAVALTSLDGASLAYSAGVRLGDAP